MTRLGPGEAATFGGLQVRGSAAAAAGGEPPKEGLAGGGGAGGGAARWGAQSGAVARLTRNGGREATHLWSQDAEGAAVAVLSPAGTRAREVQWELGARDLHLGEPVARHLRVLLRAPGAEEAALRVLIDAPLAYPVRAGEDDSDWEIVDFEGDNEGRRLIVFSLRKVPPAAGVRVWWNRAFEEDEPVDTASMEGRRGQPGSFSTAFKEAERQFRERLQNGDVKAPR